MRAPFQQDMLLRDGERLAKMILRISRVQLSCNTGRLGTERRRSNLAVSSWPQAVDSTPFVYTPSEGGGLQEPEKELDDALQDPQQTPEAEPRVSTSNSAAEATVILRFTRRPIRNVRAQVQPRPPPSPQTRPAAPPPPPPSSPPRSAVPRAARQRHVSTLESILLGGSPARLSQTPQTDAHPSGRLEHPAASSPAPRLPPQTDAGTPGPTHSTSLAEGITVADDSASWLGTGEGLGCVPKDEKGRLLHQLLQRSALMRRVLHATQPYLGHNRIDTVGEVDSESLELAFQQLPNNWYRKDLDWSATAELAEEVPAWSQIPRECATGMEAAAEDEAAKPVRVVRAVVDGEVLDVLPMWICVHQEDAEGPARLYESIFPMDAETYRRVEELSEGQEGDCFWQPFCQDVSGLNFTRQSDEPRGSWHNFFVGVVGSVSPFGDEDALWPNRMLHRGREMFNVRHGMDLAAFLAEPVKADMDSHLQNLRRIQLEKQYAPQWSFYMMKKRWGITALKEHNFA